MGLPSYHPHRHDRADSAAAGPLLSATDQEAIALAVLDGLTAPEAAAVLGISSTALRLRLSRARRTCRRGVPPVRRWKQQGWKGPQHLPVAGDLGAEACSLASRSRTISSTVSSGPHAKGP